MKDDPGRPGHIDLFVQKYLFHTYSEQVFLTEIYRNTTSQKIKGEITSQCLSSCYKRTLPSDPVRDRWPREVKGESKREPEAAKEPRAGNSDARGVLTLLLISWETLSVPRFPCP